jgi:hypothetical protein
MIEINRRLYMDEQSGLKNPAFEQIRAFDALEEATMNAALAIIHSMQPQSELQALLAVQIIATGFSALKYRIRESEAVVCNDSIVHYMLCGADLWEGPPLL